MFKLAKKKRLIVVHCGDLVDGVHHNSLQVMNEVEDQAEAFMELMLPVLLQNDRGETASMSIRISVRKCACIKKKWLGLPEFIRP